MITMLYFVHLLSVPIQQEWAWSAHPESGFKILSPVTLIHGEKEVPVASEVIHFHQYHGGSVSDHALPLAFVIDHYAVPSADQALDQEYLREFFKSTVDQLLLSVGGDLLYMDLITQTDQERCIWKASYQNGDGVIRGHSILVNGKYYGLQVFGWKDKNPDEMMTKFLESFRLIAHPSSGNE